MTRSDLHAAAGPSGATAERNPPRVSPGRSLRGGRRAERAAVRELRRHLRTLDWKVRFVPLRRFAREHGPVLLACVVCGLIVGVPLLWVVPAVKAIGTGVVFFLLIAFVAFEPWRGSSDG